MELKPGILLLLFAGLAGAFCLFQEPLPGGSFKHGLWRGRVETVTAGGAVVSTADGSLWVSSEDISTGALRGDSLLVLGNRRGRFVTPFAIRLKPSRSPVATLRRRFRNLLVSNIPHEGARGLTGGLLMGLRGLIPHETSGAFKRSGTSHLLALSGLHTALVAAVLLWLSGRFLGKRPLSAGLAVAGIAAFVLLSGCRPSTVRAGIMSSAVIFHLRARGGRIHLLTVWWAALGLSLLLLPGTLHDRGAQMSYGAVLSLILLGKNIRGPLGFMLSPLHAGVTVTVAMAPLIGSIYGGVAWLGPTATVVSLPFMTSIMVIGAAAASGLVYALPVLTALASAWQGILEFMAHRPLDPPGGTIWPIWAAGVILLRVTAQWNGFHRRFR